MQQASSLSLAFCFSAVFGFSYFRQWVCACGQVVLAPLSASELPSDVWVLAIIKAKGDEDGPDGEETPSFASLPPRQEKPQNHSVALQWLVLLLLLLNAL